VAQNVSKTEPSKPKQENTMDEQEVVTLMASSLTAVEWNANCDKVKNACGGYPSFWFDAVIRSGVAAKTAANFGGSADVKTK
jgi:hypothetical protein